MPARADGERGWFGATVVLLAHAVVVAGCGADRPGAETPAAAGPGAVLSPSVRVVGGVRLMEHGAGAFERAPRLTIDPEPLAVLGGAEGEGTYDLTYASSVVLLDDGRIATLSPIGSRLLIFAADGKGERSLGRMGRGPGEIMGPDGMIALEGDTLFVPDSGNRRFNWVLPDGPFVASRPMEGLHMPFMQTAGVLPDGRVVVHSGGLVEQRGDPDEVVRPPTPVFVVHPASGENREIARLPNFELVMQETRYRGNRRMDATLLGFSRAAHIAVWDTLVATSADAGYVVDLRDPDGRIVSRLTVDRPRRPVTKEMRDAEIARQLERFDRTSGEGYVDLEESKRLVREGPFADSLPDYGGFFVTPNRTLWVLDAFVPAEPWSATAFRPDGAITGRLTVPADALPMAFGDDRVVLRSTDEDDVVSLQVHRIVAAP